MHHLVELRVGQRATCVDCGATLSRHRISDDAALAFTLSAVILAVPAAELPLVTVRKFGAEHASYLWTGVRALWQDGMPLLSVWVALCGILVPLTLLATLMVAIAERAPMRQPTPRFWSRWARSLQQWSMPEVQVLAILVAFVKIGALVNVEPGPGLWFYAAMTLAMLLAWRSAELAEVG